jgi:hypothetical protein
MLEALVAKKGINNYLNPAARDASITSPVTGTIAFIRQDSSGNIVNELQFYNGSGWEAVLGQSVLDSIDIKILMDFL